MSYLVFLEPCTVAGVLVFPLLLLLWGWGRLWNREWSGIGTLLLTAPLLWAPLNIAFQAQNMKAAEAAEPAHHTPMDLHRAWQAYAQDYPVAGQQDTERWPCYLVREWGKHPYGTPRAMHNDARLSRLVQELHKEDKAILTRAEQFRDESRRKITPLPWSEAELQQLSSVINNVTHSYMKEAYADNIRKSSTLSLPLCLGGMLIALFITAFAALRDIRLH